MKELSIEEKAKAYDEAIEKLRSLHDDYDTVSTLIDIKEELENIFPELKEREDEMVWLKKFIQEEIDCLSIDIRDCEDRIKLQNLRRSLTWLEKKGQVKESQISKHENKTCKESDDSLTSEDERIRKAIINVFATHKDYEIFFGASVKDILAWLERQGKNNMGISEATKKKLEDNLNKALEKETPESWNKFLDEHKLVIKIKTPEESLGISSEEYNKIVDECIYSDDKLTWSEEDENMLKSIIATCELAEQDRDSSPARHLLEMQTNWLKSLKDRCLPQPKQEWSEEDENRFNNLIFLVECSDENEPTKNGFIDFINRLKSLRPQNKNITSKEFEEVIREIKTRIAQCNGFNRKHREEVFSLLDTIRPQNRWKPSDEQMKMVDKIINVLSQMQLFGGRNALIDLKHDLEKLREE